MEELFKLDRSRLSWINVGERYKLAKEKYKKGYIHCQDTCSSSFIWFSSFPCRWQEQNGSCSLQKINLFVHLKSWWISGQTNNSW